MTSPRELERQISSAMHADQFGLRQMLRSITAAEKAGRPFDRLLEKLQSQLQRSLQRSLQLAEDELAAQARLTRELQDDLLRTRMVELDRKSVV